MCTYNGARYISEQLRSIAAQTRLPDELVICDDCSSDKTIEIINEFTAGAPFSIRLFENCDTLGSTKNFEKAFENCKYDVIVPCDQDDSWYPDKLNLTERAFIANSEAGVVFGDADIVNEDLTETGRRLWEDIDFSNGLQQKVDAGLAFDALLKYNFVTGATMAFRAKFLPLVIPVPDRWVHDAWIAILVSGVASVIRIDRPLIKYRQHSGQQLGPRRRGINVHLSTVQARNSRDEYRQKQAQYKLVYDRLQEQEEFRIHDRVEELLQSKIQHVTSRAQLPHSRLRRLPAIGKEFLLNHYRDFGHGWKGAVRDLLVNLDDR